MTEFLRGGRRQACAPAHKKFPGRELLRESQPPGGTEKNGERQAWGNCKVKNQICNIAVQLFPYTGMVAPRITRASSEQRNNITRAISSGFGHLEKSACGIAARLAAVSMMLGSTEFTLMLYAF